MKTLFIPLFTLVISFVLYGQDSLCYEKIAFEYFESSLLKIQYPKKTKFLLANKISERISGTLDYPRFQDYPAEINNVSENDVKTIREFLYTYRIRNEKCLINSRDKKMIQPLKNMKFKRRKKYISVYQANMWLRNLVFVEITIMDRYSEFHFFIEIDSKTFQIKRYDKVNVTVSY